MYYLFSCSSDGKSVALAHVLKVFFSPYMMDTVGVAKLEVVSTGFYLKMRNGIPWNSCRALWLCCFLVLRIGQASLEPWPFTAWVATEPHCLKRYLVASSSVFFQARIYPISKHCRILRFSATGCNFSVFFSNGRHCLVLVALIIQSPFFGKLVSLCCLYW